MKKFGRLAEDGGGLVHSANADPASLFSGDGKRGNETLRDALIGSLMDVEDGKDCGGGDGGRG